MTLTMIGVVVGDVFCGPESEPITNQTFWTFIIGKFRFVDHSSLPFFYVESFEFMLTIVN